MLQVGGNFLECHQSLILSQSGTLRLIFEEYQGSQHPGRDRFAINVLHRKDMDW